MDKEPAQRGSHPLAYRIEDAAAAIGIGRSTMFEFIKDGQIPARKIGNSTVIRHRDLEAFLDAAPLSAATRNAQRAKGISLGSAAPDKLVIRGADEVTGTSPQASRSGPMTDPGRSVVPFQVAARELGLNAATLRRMCKDGRGPILLRLSERRLGIRKRDLDAWLESRGIVPGSGGGAKIRFRERKG